MSPPTAPQLRQLFLSFFAARGHTVVRSSPLVPQDPTLLFTNAGMVQFKDAFTGRSQLGFRRAATVQKCVRAGGKHNDLDNVGRTARHHTFFEMLGNFSFGDYFKEEAIVYAWELVTRELGLPPERLAFTVFGGEDDIPPDEEARDLWRRVAGVPPERIIALGKKDNFWMMGDTGPQGPCSEIHVYQGEDHPCAEETAGRRCLGPACDCDRWLEIWNLVFMQFERQEPGGPLRPLPAPCIDTGAGLERLTAVVQGHRSNYDTDLFAPLVAQVAEASGRRYGGGDEEDDVSMRVLADHSRATAFLIADGVLPSNLGRGYVLRSIMRRAIRHAVRLGLPHGFFGRLCLRVSEQMGSTYPELLDARGLIGKAVDAEDEAFRRTIHRGLKLIADMDTTTWQQRGSMRVMPGEMAFLLHDTYGFPLDLTQVIGREQGFVVDEEGFRRKMEEQASRSRFAGSGAEVAADVYKAVLAEVGPVRFVGYSRDGGCRGRGRVLALVLPGGQRSQEAGEGQEVDVITDETPFYGRAGGQVGDTGRMRSEGAELEVLDTLRPLPELIVHRARLCRGTLRVGDEVELLVDQARRDLVRKNHSATHLLHHALRKVLGEHVTQKGSYVGPDKLTFDFSHFAPLSEQERRRIEEMVNEAIWRNDEQQVTETSFEEARRLGAMALFGEKYGERVRVMRLGESVELCGGTHVFRTGDIGLFKITSEASVAQGIRRIEALTGPAALARTAQQEEELARAAELLRSGPLEVAARVQRLLEDLKARDREIERLRERLLTQGSTTDRYGETRQVRGVKVVTRNVGEADPKALREGAEKLLDQLAAGLVVLGGLRDGKAQLVVAARKDLVADPASPFHAGRLVGQLAAIVGGRGGGRPDLAQAGGPAVDRLDEALRTTFALLGDA
ncbi:MAG: alanine--tRNA ligase [Myxococcales bacterium]|nr:alanine--tRNA ligase [Myxococcota bacterium]MDW8281619.1 alanine--tRNA ligase [Myxococcales bacterium]